MSKEKMIGFIFLLVIVITGGWFLRQKFGKHQESQTRTLTVSEGPIETTLEATGSVAPLNRVEIKPPISGRIEQLLVEEGTRIKAGQILAWMSSSDRAAILDAAMAQGPEAFKRWEDNYKPTPIIAPLSGMIILRSAVVGQTVDPGTVLFAMSDSLTVLAQVDESEISHIQVGMPARIILDAYPTQIVPAKVTDILHEGKNVSNVITYGVKVQPIQVPSFFRSQMTANVSFIVSSKDKAVLIPPSLIREQPNGTKQVFVPGPNGKTMTREIITGIESSDKVEVVSGLQSGEQIIINGGKYVPQQGPQSSPLTFGGRPSRTNSGQAPRQRKQ